MENDLHGGVTVEQNEKYAEWLLRRNSLMRQIGSLVININVSGDSRRKCGDVVSLNITELEPSTKEDRKVDKYITGKYLVTSIKHNITPDGYFMDMECSRDSVGEDYPTVSNFLGSQDGSPPSTIG